MITNSMYLGEKRKISVHVEPLNGISMEDIEELIIHVYCSQEKYIEYKANRNDGEIAQDHQLLLDTTKVGIGGVAIEITAYISDGSVEGQRLVDIARINTGINIIK